MIIVLTHDASDAQREQIVKRIEANGLKAHISQGAERTVIGVVGDDRSIDPAPFAALAGVEQIVPILKPFKLASRDFQSDPTQIMLPGGVIIGGQQIVVMAGPCAVENEQQLVTTAQAIKAAGGHILRGGAFKPRTSPYAFQGLAETGLKYLAAARDVTSMPIVTEVMSVIDVELVAKYADILQIGARNMQNYNLLREVGLAGKPVLLKRGLAATLEEMCLAAEYILAQGNRQVMLCERGIRTFEKATRNTLDLSAVPVLKQWTHLPVVVDPSHGTGKRSLIGSMSLAAIAAGADALIIEAHPNPEQAISDGPQTLDLQQFATLMQQAKAVAAAVGRTL
ncbi:MAG: 3-deoxy-7-phosphoheptulonate synthase [Deltaproteobacteria bacterium]|nr:3-deoxy-7-phosphoheptulonate synthase [Deltaproteobacteria bacterium]